MNDLEKLFLSKLKHMYDAEHQVVEALSEMQEAAEPSVKNALTEHLEESREQVRRVSSVFDDFGQSPERKTCHGMAGIINEGRRMLQQMPGSAPLILSARKIEHYEISSYGSLCTWAEKLDRKEVLRTLKQNLSEEKEAAQTLAALAESTVPDTNELSRLFQFQLREMYDGEHLLAQALAEIEFYAVSKVLKFAVHHHLKQTDKHFKRLEKVFKRIDVQPDRRPCKGIEGIIDDAQVTVLEFLDNSALDAALIAAGQVAEHYEIVTYEALCGWAKELGQIQALDLLSANLNEEKRTDKALTL